MKPDELKEFYLNKPDDSDLRSSKQGDNDNNDELRKASETFDILCRQKINRNPNKEDVLATNTEKAAPMSTGNQLVFNKKGNDAKEPINQSSGDSNEVYPDKILNVHFSSNLEVDKKFCSELCEQDRLKLEPVPPVKITAKELIAVLEDLNLVNSRHYFKAMLCNDL